MSLPKVTFHVYLSSQPFQGKECETPISALVHLSILNATVPACNALTSRELCFSEMDLSFHIKENKPPGTFHQLQLPPIHHLCQNVSISYKLLAGKTGGKPFSHGHINEIFNRADLSSVGYSTLLPHKSCRLPLVPLI